MYIFATPDYVSHIAGYLGPTLPRKPLYTSINLLKVS